LISRNRLRRVISLPHIRQELLQFFGITFPDEGQLRQHAGQVAVGTGKEFTAAQKGKIIAANKAKNVGVVKSDLSGDVLTKPQKSQRGITPNPREWQIDHIIPKDRGDRLLGPQSLAVGKELPY